MNIDSAKRTSRMMTSSQRKLTSSEELDVSCASVARPQTPVCEYSKQSAPRTLYSRIKRSNYVGTTVESNFNFWADTRASSQSDLSEGHAEVIPTLDQLDSRHTVSNDRWLRYNIWARRTIGMRPHRPFIPRRSAPGRFSSHFLTPLNVITAQGVLHHVRAL